MEEIQQFTEPKVSIISIINRDLAEAEAPAYAPVPLPETAAIKLSALKEGLESLYWGFVGLLTVVAVALIIGFTAHITLLTLGIVLGVLAVAFAGHRLYHNIKTSELF